MAIDGENDWDWRLEQLRNEGGKEITQIFDP
jgi:hypothetical protein